VIALDLRRHEVVVEHTSGAGQQVPLTPHRAVGDVTRDVLAAVGHLVGPVEINPTPQEVPWTVALDEDDEHAHYDAQEAASYFVAATRAAQVLTEFRAPFRGRSTPVTAWWGAFDLAVNLFSGQPVDPPSEDFLVRNSADAQSIAVGWWPGDLRYPRAAFYGYAYPAPEELAKAHVSPAPARFDAELGEFILDWDDVRASRDPHADALQFARSVFARACVLGNWDETLVASMNGMPPPLRPARGA
jgi:hypothetical protein